MNLSSLNILEILCIFVFGSILFVWVVRYNNIKDEFKSFKLPKWLRDLVGIFKLSFATMLLNDSLDIVCLGAMGIALLMGAAVIIHLRKNSPFHRILPSLSLLLICSYIAYRSFAFF